MKRKGNLIRQLLYKNLSFENYLLMLSKLYFVSFNLGLLKRNKYIAYPYFLKKIVQKGDVVIDIGANLGYLTVLFSKRVKKEGKVYAVEPVEPALNILKKNTRKFENVVIYPYALGKEDKTIFMGNDSLSKAGFIASGSNYVIGEGTRGKEGNEIQFKAEMKKGSELFKDLNRLDYIKIDVEGYETTIIPELEPLIERFKPIMLVESRGENRKAILRYMIEREYRALVLHGNKLYPTNENEFWDMLLVHDDRLERVSEYLT